MAEDELKTLNRLIQKINGKQREYERREKYYLGSQRLLALGLALPPQMEPLMTVINWCGMYVNSLEERLDVEGFRLSQASASGSSASVDVLWDWWQYNNLVEESSLAHTEALFSGGSYVTVGANDDGDLPPIITPESSRWMHHETDYRLRQTSAAARLYRINDKPSTGATLYLPDSTIYYKRDHGGKPWSEDGRDDHGLGEVLVVPMVNRARLSDRHGDTEMRDIMGITDAACRTLTNLQAAQELMAIPQRWLAGVNADDFIDPRTGERLSSFEAYIGLILAIGNDNVKAGQFAAADLRNFTEVVNQYSRLVSAMTGLPPHYLGFTSDNPASADAIRSSDARIVKKAERKQGPFGGTWEKAMRLGLRIKGDDRAALAATRLETTWADPGIPTFSALSQAVTAQFQAGLIPKEYAWKKLRYSPEDQKELARLSSADPMRQLEEFLRNPDSDQVSQPLEQA